MRRELHAHQAYVVKGPDQDELKFLRCHHAVHHLHGAVNQSDGRRFLGCDRQAEFTDLIVVDGRKLERCGALLKNLGEVG